MSRVLATVVASLTPDAPAEEDLGPEPELDINVPGADAVDSFAEAVTRNIDSPVVEQIVQGLIQPGVKIVLILLFTALILAVLRKLIDRAVQRAKDPDAARGSRLKRRVGFASDTTPAFSLRRAQRADALGALIASIVTVVVWALAVFLILAEFGLNLAPLVAGAGVIGLAVGFGAQDLVKDFLSGVFMLAEDQYGVGDIIDVGEAAGVVEGVTLRTTRVRDIEGTLWHVPNGEIRRVGNSSQDWARSLLDVAVPYDVDVDLASEIIEGVANAMAEEEDYRELFLDAPAVWGVQALGADSVDVRLVIKTQPGAQWGITRELRRRIKSAFDVAGIEIPYQQRTLWIRNDEDHAVPDPGSVAQAIHASTQGGKRAADVAKQDEAADADEIERELTDEDETDPPRA